MSKTTEQLLCLAAREIWEKQGINTLGLDLRSISTITDFYLVSEGQVERHVKSLASAVIELFANEGLRPLHIEGWTVGDWIVLDFGFCIVHLFLPQMRRHYCLEETWKRAQLIDLQIPSDVLTPDSELCSGQ